MNWHDKLWPQPQTLRAHDTRIGMPTCLQLRGEALQPFQKEDLEQIGQIAVSDRADALPLTLAITRDRRTPESYALSIREQGISIAASDATGLSYGIELLVQILALHRHQNHLPAVEIEDHPDFAVRAGMVDLGRTVASLPMLKRLVRVYRRLRLNQMHLRLFDDELCGIRFNNLPCGHDNPFALSISELAELIAYGQSHHVQIMPEIETWGHVGSIVYDRLELRGGDGMFNGSSLRICPEAMDLIEQITDQIVALLPNDATVHLGFDEARWYPSEALPHIREPADLLLHYYRMVQGLNEKHSKNLTMQIWADHAGRPVPDAIERDKLIVQPWNYWNTNQAHQDQVLRTYSGEDKRPWTMGVGQSLAQPRGAYHATRYFCQQAKDSPNVRGGTVCLWGWNDWHRLLLTYFAGAYYCWNAQPGTAFAEVEDYEAYDRQVYEIMHWWQTTFRDAWPDALERDRGPLVFKGFYLWGEKHGQPVAPSAAAANTLYGHDYVNEHLMAAD